MAASNAKKAREAQAKKDIDDLREKNMDEALFNRQYYQDMTDRSEVQHMLRQLRDNQAQARSRSEARGAVMGQTAEQEIAHEDSLHKSYGDSISRIVSNASSLKDQYLRQYQGDMKQYYSNRRQRKDEEAGSYQNMSNQWGQAANQAFATAANMAGIAAGAATGAAGGGATGGSAGGGAAPAHASAVDPAIAENARRAAAQVAHAWGLEPTALNSEASQYAKAVIDRKNIGYDIWDINHKKQW